MYVHTWACVPAKTLAAAVIASRKPILIPVEKVSVVEGTEVLQVGYRG